MALVPVGPLPAATYWRRRGVVLLAFMVMLLVVKSCAGSAPRKVAVTPRPTPTTSVAAKPLRPAAPVAIAVCVDSVLDLSTSTDAPSYAVGGTPKLTLAVKNTSATPCRRDLGSGAVELLVYSGADRVWSSDDCGQGKGVSLATLAAGASQAVVHTWSGKRSAPGCGGSRAQAKAGTYRVVARVGTLRKEGAVFRFSG